MIRSLILSEEEKLLYHRFNELCLASKQKNKAHFTFFLNMREQKIALEATKDTCVLFGGFENAERKMMGIFPSENDEGEFPLSAVEILHNKKDTLSHRDVLGSITGMGISRESIGDIIPSLSSCVVLCTNTVKPVLIQELKKIGSAGVKCGDRPMEGIVSAQDYENIAGTVSSLRLDSLVALIARTSRKKASDLIVSGLVVHDYQLQEKGTACFSVDEIVTIRGYGKYIVDRVGQPTRKGRFPIECRKYR